MALAILALSEGVVRVGEHGMAPPNDWYYRYVGQLVDEAEFLQEAGVTSDVLFVGTSMVRRGIDAEVIEDRLASVGQAHNAAIPAAQIPVVRRWVLEEMVPRLKPKRVVWGLSSLDFNPNRADLTIEFYNAARATRPGWVGSIDRMLGRVLAVSRHRVALRDPATLGGLLDFPGDSRAEPDDRGRRNLDRLMAPRNNWDEPLANIPREIERVQGNALNEFEVSDSYVAMFRATIDDLQAAGIEVVVILMPVPERYIGAHPKGTDDFEEFLQAVTTELDSSQVAWFDYSHAMGEGDFHDVTHLNGKPARRFSRVVASHLAELGW